MNISHTPCLYYRSNTRLVQQKSPLSVECLHIYYALHLYHNNNTGCCHYHYYQKILNLHYHTYHYLHHHRFFSFHL